jgi:hypothetical protein
MVLPSDYDVDDEVQNELVKEVSDILEPSTSETNGATEKPKSKNKNKKKNSAKTSSGKIKITKNFLSYFPRSRLQRAFSFIQEHDTTSRLCYMNFMEQC